MSQEQNHGENIWDQALDGVDLSKLDNGKEDEYRLIPPSEISEAASTDTLRWLLMRQANENLKEARAQAEGEISRERKYHDEGWSISIETPRGIVGLWSCWLGNRFYLGFPNDVSEVTDELIMKTLDVERALPVRQVNAIAVNDWNYEGEFADKDKPLEKTEAGQIIGYSYYGQRLWAKFYGPIENSGGRIWVDFSDFESSGLPFPYIDASGNLNEIYYGHDRSMSISTFPFNFHNKYAEEGPITDKESIQRYREKFIRLASEIAFLMRGAKAICIDYGQSMVPEDLYREDYQNICWLKGDLGERKGFGNEVVRGQKGDSTVILKSGNSVVPWSTILSLPASRLTSPEMLANFIKEDVLWF